MWWSVLWMFVVTLSMTNANLPCLFSKNSDNSNSQPPLNEASINEEERLPPTSLAKRYPEICQPNDYLVACAQDIEKKYGISVFI
jgi:hypothetical protein